MSQKTADERSSFLLKNLLTGFLILGLFIIAFILFKKFGGVDYLVWLEPLYSRPPLVLLIYSLSEIFFGIITPEIFMAWGLSVGDNLTYASIITLLMLISYGAGWLNYWAGRTFRRVPIVRLFLLKRMKTYTSYLNRFGGFLLIVASTTPLPYAAICLLVGSVNFSHRKFLLYTLTRLLRFAVYGYIVWGANKI